MKKQNNDRKNILYSVGFISIGVLFSIGLVEIGMWPVAVLFGAISAIFPVAVILDKIGLIELVEVNKKTDSIGYEKQLRYEEDRKRVNKLFEETYNKSIIPEKTIKYPEPLLHEEKGPKLLKKTYKFKQ